MPSADKKPTEKTLYQLKELVKPTLLLSVSLAVTSGVVLIVQALIIAAVVHKVMIEGATLSDMLPRLIWLLPMILLRSMLVWLSERVAFSASAVIRQSLRSKLLQQLLTVDGLKFKSEQSGELATVLVDGVEALEGYYARYLPHLAVMALVPLAILAAVTPSDWISALIMLFTAPFIPLFTILIGRGAEKLNQRQWRTLARLGGYFLDRVNGLATLRIFNASRREALLITRISDEYRRSTMSVLYVAFLSALVLEFFATVSVAVMAVIIGFRLLYGKMAFQDGFTVLLLAPEFYLPLRQMGSYYHARMEAIGAAERIFNILDNTISLHQTHLPALSITAPINICFENVTFRYENDAAPAVDKVSFSFKKGERMVLTGASGAGKSTLAAMLLGFVKPDSGAILINGINLQNCNIDEWHKLVAWVPQRPHLFRGTIADNIRIGRLDASDAELAQAAYQARCDEFINLLPFGMDTVIGEHGAGLSGGQARRIALARAFLKDAPLLVTDEPTAGLDSCSEKLVREALNQLARQCAVLSIAHRLDTIENSDKIIVMAGGRVAESGDRDRLILAGGLFAKMVVAGDSV